MENALKEMMQRISSTKNAVPKKRETADLANNRSPHLGWANAKSMGKNDVGNLRLQIQTKLSDLIFTGKKLEGEGGAHISFALINANTGDVVRSGLESSIKLDIVVLEGDFNNDDEDNWAQEEFENYVVKERERKGLLLTGDLQLTLKGGVGELGELIFMDNSSWNRSKRFRIGLKVASGYSGNTRIREAKTDAFRVKEHRGESNKKHYPPAFDDEVWRLEKIAKDGKSHQKLMEAGIHKVEDFLQKLFTDSKKLRQVLGKSITPKNWESLVDHAKTSAKWKTYLDDPNGMRKHDAVFNTDHQLTGLIEDMVYFAPDRLSAQEKEPGDTIVEKAAFNNWNDVREFNGQTYSASVQKNSYQVIEGQIGNPVPVQCYLAPRTCAAPVGPEAPPANAGSTVEGHNGVTGDLAWPVQSQNTNCGDAVEFPVDDSVPLFAPSPVSADRLNGVLSPGDDGIATFGLPIQSPDIVSRYAMRSQMDYTVNEDVVPPEPPYAPTSSHQWSGTFAPFPEGNHVMGDFQFNGADDWVDYLLASLEEDDDTSLQTPPWGDGYVWGQQRC
ncbi:calmodulin-binding protein 60 D-like isoform X2 [Syzygium oleosum]|nr:calmodulin-binding protein 60 D-like isoform X2 [Syzygium oleosum]XP_056171940.1 calmodulin-binding protein 60 D-like isoform X2 [Syzygium oleosum]